MDSSRKYSTRIDAWTDEEDRKLADNVLGNIRKGYTQMRAFEESANLLGRTVAACGYRWNAVLRKKYNNKIIEAKIARKNEIQVFFNTN